MEKRITFLSKSMLFIAVLLLIGGCSADDTVVFTDSSVDTVMEEYSEVSEAKDDSVQSIGESDTVFETVIFEENSRIAVHVCGAVNKAGVYELEEDSRVIDAVLAAGGFADTADKDYINLATVLTDGDRVRIPTTDETAELADADVIASGSGITGTAGLDAAESMPDKVNINTAGAEELCTLPGIGQTRAESILTYRREHGDFSKIEDIMLVSGIKENSFQKIKDKITVK